MPEKIPANVVVDNKACARWASVPSNNSMQRPALRAAADAAR
jgi:hypothetical protein